MVSTEIEGRALLSKFQSLAALKDINVSCSLNMPDHDLTMLL